MKDKSAETATVAITKNPVAPRSPRNIDQGMAATRSPSEPSILTQLNALGESISLGGSEESSLYYISVKHEDRDTARRITQALLTVFIEGSLGDKRTDNSDAQNFLENRTGIESDLRARGHANQRVRMFPQTRGGVGHVADSQLVCELARATDVQ